MNEIEVWQEGRIIYRFGESIFLKCGDSNFFMIDEAQSYLNSTVWEMYKVWAKKSTVDGTNKTYCIKYDDTEIFFINHYWD